MSFLPTDLTSIAWGVLLGVIGAVGAGFLKKAGEELYLWAKKKIHPRSSESNSSPLAIHINKDGARKSQEETPPDSLQSGAIKRISSVSLDDIRNAIKAAPPLQRDRVAKSYVGLRIEWDAYFSGGIQKEDGSLSLRLEVKSTHTWNFIHCDVPFDEYRELGVLPENTPIRVSGEISEVGLQAIDLKDVRLMINSS